MYLGAFPREKCGTLIPLPFSLFYLLMLGWRVWLHPSLPDISTWYSHQRLQDKGLIWLWSVFNVTLTRVRITWERQQGMSVRTYPEFTEGRTQLGCGWHHPMGLGPRMNKKGEKTQNSWLPTSIFPLPGLHRHEESPSYMPMAMDSVMYFLLWWTYPFKWRASINLPSHELH